ncbi:MAG: PatA/PatG family cyanobactin maturation protease [Planctomycetia bacterium]|nr:PatA/PatG family cyanobactin maturation protease [Planctomycetia bacterium]
MRTVSVRGAALNVSDISGLTDLWAHTLGDPRICIAVLDGPADLSHHALLHAKITRIRPSLPIGSSDGRALQHGTHITSVIFGDHESPIRGIAPHCRGVLIPIFSDFANGTPLFCSQLDLARAILQALQAGAHVINVSGGHFAPSGTAHPLLTDAVRSCARSGALIVAAAGNDGCSCLHVPAALPSVLAVGATDRFGEPLSFSNWGSVYNMQGIVAPGDDIVGALPGGGIATASGTSFAAAIVSGVAALLLSMQVRRGQRPDVFAVRKALLDAATGATHPRTAARHQFLRGRLNITQTFRNLFIGDPQMGLSTNEVTASCVLPAEPQAQTDSGIQPATDSNSRLPSAAPGDRPDAQPRGDDIAVTASAVSPSSCGCGANTASPMLAYVLGQLGIDFRTEARRDAFVQDMDAAPGMIPNPDDHQQLLDYLQANPWAAASLIWTLSLDGTTIYAVVPQGPFAGDAYNRLRQILKEQLTEGVERISVPGVIAGSVRTSSGQYVPVIIPEIRGLYSWSTTALVETVVGPTPAVTASDSDKATHSGKTAGVHEFLDRVYFELRNLGITSQERAMNYAGTNAFNIARVYEAAMKDNMELDTIDVERSPICRPESDCWDVKLVFFYPDRQVQTVRKAYRFTVDVSDVMPITIGPVRSWSMR